jgi:GxxExxY protein
MAGLRRAKMRALPPPGSESNLTNNIIRAAHLVHRRVGPGYHEAVYLREMAWELERRSYGVHSRFPVDVWNGSSLQSLFFVDMFVEGQVIVEIEATSQALADYDRGQVSGYLQVTGARTGLLLNFGRRYLEYMRVYPADKPANQHSGRESLP